MSYPPAPARARTATPMAAAVLMVLFVGLLWVEEIIDAMLGHQLDTWGITPRLLTELPDIATAPFLHAGVEHLAANTGPLFVLGFAAAVRGLRRFFGVSALIIVVSGVGVWFTAPPNTVTLGASGLIFGYFSYVVLRGFIDRNALDIVVGVLVAIFYGGLVWGVLPTEAAVSWQGHLFGFVGGVLGAFIFRR